MSSINKMNVGGVDYDICKDEIDEINSDLTALSASLSDVEYEIIWFNSTPTSEFAARTINFPTGGYNSHYLYILMCGNLTSNLDRSMYILDFTTATASNTITALIDLSTTHAPYFYSRTVTRSSDQTKFIISDCTQADMVTGVHATNNGCLIPLQLLAVKLKHSE